MVFQHSGGRDFDLPRHSHYSGVIPMVFQHSAEAPIHRQRTHTVYARQPPTTWLPFRFASASRLWSRAWDLHLGTGTWHPCPAACPSEAITSAHAPTNDIFMKRCPTRHLAPSADHMHASHRSKLLLVRHWKRWPTTGPSHPSHTTLWCTCGCGSGV